MIGRRRPLAVLGAALLACAASSAAHAGTNLISNWSFEGSRAGWTAYRSTVTLARDGAVGKDAVRVVWTGRGRTYGLAGRPVPDATAADVYTASTYLRTDDRGQTLCLRIREWRAAGRLVGSRATCVRGSRRWRQTVTLAYRVRASGDRLGLDIFDDHPTRPRSAFETDGVTLVDTAPTVLAAGDVAYCPGAPSASGSAQTAQILARFPDDPVFVLGDSQYDDGALAEYQACFDKTWGAYRSRIHPAPGYHDYETAGAAGYFGYYGPQAGIDGQGWYSFDLGTWHVVVLNAPLCNQDGCPPSDPQVQWLESDLAAHRTRCTLAAFAYPLFDSGSEDGPTPSMRTFWQELYNAGVDVILNGHEHDYERFAPQTPDGAADPRNGIREFVVGTGGRSLYAFGAPQANSQVRYDRSFGVLQLTLHAASYDWRYLPVAGASFTDSGSTVCH